YSVFAPTLYCSRHRSVQVNPSVSQATGEFVGSFSQRIRGGLLICSGVHLQQKGRAPGNEGGAEGRAPGGGVVPAGIRGNDPFPRSRQFDVVVAELENALRASRLLVEATPKTLSNAAG